MDGGKTISKTIMLSTPNKENVIDQNTSIAAGGNNVHITWWTNKTGTLEPLFKASNDGGNASEYFLQDVDIARERFLADK